MRAIATKQPANDSAKEKKNGNRVRSRSVSPLSTGMPLVQRQCACGGGCPRCQEKLGIQTKLKISEPGDKYEQEADRIADEVMRMPSPTSATASMVQRQETADSSATTTSLDSQINHLQGGGQPLDSSLRAFFEPRFGYDFSQVRIHTGTGANQLVQAFNAKAFTQEQNIVFGSEHYSPKTTQGQRLIAHELAHIIQQNGGNSGSLKIQRQPLSIIQLFPEERQHDNADVDVDVAPQPTGIRSWLCRLRCGWLYGEGCRDLCPIINGAQCIQNCNRQLHECIRDC